MPPEVDMELERNTNETVLNAIKAGNIVSAHDIADGGLSIALAECCILNKSKPIGIEATISSELIDHQLFFSESQSRYIVSLKPEHQSDFESICNSNNIMFQNIGKTGGENFAINGKLNFSIKEISEIYYETISKIMASK